MKLDPPALDPTQTLANTHKNRVWSPFGIQYPSVFEQAPRQFAQRLAQSVTTR